MTVDLECIRIVSCAPVTNDQVPEDSHRSVVTTTPCPISHLVLHLIFEALLCQSVCLGCEVGRNGHVPALGLCADPRQLKLKRLVFLVGVAFVDTSESVGGGKLVP